MTTRICSFFLIGLGLLLTSVAIGCAATALPAQEAVMCPKCETVWVQAPDPDDLYGLVYRAEESTRCPDCHTAVGHFFRTGELTHTCATCDGELMHCTLQR